jgi:hypothetical protein
MRDDECITLTAKMAARLNTIGCLVKYLMNSLMSYLSRYIPPHVCIEQLKFIDQPRSSLLKIKSLPGLSDGRVITLDTRS